MNRTSALLVGLAFVLISFGLCAFYYGRMPAQMPIHWDAAGHANGYAPRLWGVFLWPAMVTGLWLLLLLLPVVSPKGFRIDQFMGTYNLIVTAIIALMLFTSALAYAAAAGSSLPIPNLVIGAIGLLFVVIGNYMGKFRKNFFIGVRTPWTLASDEVWARTHRLAGWIFIAGGLALVVQGFTGVNQAVLLAVVGIVTIVPIAYSFFEYKRVEGLGPNGT